MNKKVLMMVLIAINVVFYIGGYFLPWRFGVFAIERYPYSSAYQVIFFLTVISTVYIFLLYRGKNIRIAKGLIWGGAIGYFSSIVAYIISSSFFYTSEFSTVGLYNYLEMMKTNPIRYIFEILIYVFLLLGWAYGAVMILVSLWLKGNTGIKRTSGSDLSVPHSGNRNR